MKESILNEQILFNINKWGAIYQDDLINYLTIFNYNKKVSRIYIGRLSKKGLITKIPDVKNSQKLILIPNSSKTFYNSSEDSSVNTAYYAHDSITSGLCLDIGKHSSVADINSFHFNSEGFSNKGEIVPDAEIVFWRNNRTNITHGAIEIEINQKNKLKISNKLIHYSKNSHFSHVFYFFSNHSIARTYNLVLAETEHKFNDNNNYNFNKFIFLYRKADNLNLARLDSYKTLNTDSMNTFMDLLKQNNPKEK
jgi:hypothetical protein